MHAVSTTSEQLSIGLSERTLESTVAIKVRKVSKSYPGVKALQDVDFDLETGEVHGLVGANGAGKSTLIRILSAANSPDKGEIEVGGVPLRFDDPERRKKSSIATIYQELTIIPQMTAVSNVFLSRVPTRMLVTDRKRMLRRYDELSRWMGVSIHPMAKAASLSVADRQMLEVMRAVQADQNVLIMDEPTAPLGPHERARLYDLIAALKANQVSIIFISHDLEEVLRLCDRVSVMREGCLVATRKSEGWSKESLVQEMLGEVTISTPRGGTTVSSETSFCARNVSVPGSVHDVSFSVRAGEIFGIAGLVGSGRTELLNAIAGAASDASGEVAIADKTFTLPLPIRQAIDAGIMLAPEDRKHQGLVLSRSSLVNLVLSDMRSVSRFSIIDRARRLAVGAALAQRLGFKPERLSFDAVNLSGGNQQKLVIGKWLHRGPKLLLLDEPTRGIDLGAKHEIFENIRKIASEGMSVILVSSDLEEVVENSDRVMVMAGGRSVGLLDGAEANVERILSLIFDVENQTV